MKSVEERLGALVAKGYEINIKVSDANKNGRISYEATIKQSEPKLEDISPFDWLIVQSRGVGDSLGELLNDLEYRLQKSIRENTQPK